MLSRVIGRGMHRSALGDFDGVGRGTVDVGAGLRGLAKLHHPVHLHT